MLKLVALSLAVLLAGCITNEYDKDGNPIKRGPSDELVIDDNGRLVARPTLGVAPHTIIVNGGTPTEREIRLLGVEGLPEGKAPKTFVSCQEYLKKFVVNQGEIFIKPALDADLRGRVIYGLVYIQAYERNADDTPGPIIPGGYLCVNQAMLSQGLVKIRNKLEIQDERERQRLVDAEQSAREKRLGLWSDKP